MCAPQSCSSASTGAGSPSTTPSPSPATRTPMTTSISRRRRKRTRDMKKRLFLEVERLGLSSIIIGSRGFSVVVTFKRSTAVAFRRSVVAAFRRNLRLQGSSSTLTWSSLYFEFEGDVIWSSYS
ncbi:hypothetical protein ACLB2K_047593 [Fragaria x ananassa]